MARSAGGSTPAWRVATACAASLAALPWRPVSAQKAFHKTCDMFYAMRAFPAILLLGFNRPEMMRAQIKAIAPFRPSRVYLAVDGPRPDHPGEVEKCAASSAVLDHPDWPCEVKKLVRTENLGCKRAVEEALDLFFDQEEEGIILEDDCRPGPSFLPYAAELLERYHDDPRVGMVSGNNYYGYISDSDASYRFTKQMYIWGWATWARVWKAYRADQENLSPNAEDIIRRAHLTHRGRILYKRYWKSYVQNLDTWDVPLGLWMMGQGFLNAMPRRNLVANVGYESDEGTHTAGYSYDQYLFARAEKLGFPLVHPVSVLRDVSADRFHELRAFAWLPRIFTIIGLYLGTPGRAICNIARHGERFCPALFRA